MLRSKYKEALSVAQEALKLFQSHGFRRNEGSAAMLLADAHRTMEQYREAQSAALQALNCFRLCDPPDERGEEAAQKLLDSLKQHLAPPPSRAPQGDGKLGSRDMGLS